MAPHTIILPPLCLTVGKRTTSPPPPDEHTPFTCCQTVQTWTHQSTTLYTKLPLSISSNIIHLFS